MMDRSQNESRNTLFSIYDGFNLGGKSPVCGANDYKKGTSKNLIRIKESKNIIPGRDGLFKIAIDQVNQLTDDILSSRIPGRRSEQKRNDTLDFPIDNFSEKSAVKSSRRISNNRNNLFQNSVIQESMIKKNKRLKKSVVLRKSACNYYKKTEINKSIPLGIRPIKSINLPNISNFCHKPNSMFNNSKFFRGTPKIVADSHRKRIKHFGKYIKISSNNNSVRQESIPLTDHFRSISVSNSKGSVITLKIPDNATKSCERNSIEGSPRKGIFPTPNRITKQNYFLKENLFKEDPNIQRMSFGKPIFQIV
ncbi:unnamed protein product [Moneuplotes crassus]|uniref:Uncharacterized protein n=1 Tax=Euplotes crassus TaxID=5936 RepID=A0AAD1US31_EUPCR|nr:unnamed protein product [Moneuplotes crassus]